MVCHLHSAKPQPEWMLMNLNLWTNISEIWIQIKTFSFKKTHSELVSILFMEFITSHHQIPADVLSLK